MPRRARSPWIRSAVLACAVLACAVLLPGVVAPAAASPSFDCRKVRAGSIPAMVCADDELGAFDRKLAEVFDAAMRKAVNQRPPILRAEQRGWIKGRDDCWKAQDKRACVATAYRMRIVELQARYRLVPHSGPVRYVCNRNPADEVVVNIFATDPPAIVAERGDQVSVMYRTMAAEGPRYVGRNELFRETQGEAVIRWGYDAPEMRCTRIP